MTSASGARGRTEPVALDVSVARFRSAAVALADEVRSGLATRAAMECANKLVADRYHGTVSFEAHTFNLVANALAMQLTMVVARIYDYSKRFPLVSQDKASLPVLIALLEQGDVQRRLIDEAGWAGARMKLPNMIQSVISDYKGHRLAPESDDAIKRVQSLRDQRLAHNLVPRLTNVVPEALPRYEDLDALLDPASDIVTKANLIATGHNVEFRDSEEEYKRQADSFWRKALAGAFSEADK